MHCPFCNKEETKVIDSRLITSGAQVRRRRECVNCSERFTTYESPELLMPRIIKRDGRRVPFDEDKLRMGVGKALEKRPISVERIEELLGSVKQQLCSSGEREISSKLLGELVMCELKKLDEVAYVRFASVYCRFQDVSAFRQEVDRIQEENKDVSTI